MKWILCGLTFALTVAMAVGTAAIRTGNVQLRREIERDYRRIEARKIMLRRLSVTAIEQVTPERLVVLLRSLVQPPQSGTAAGTQAGTQAGSETSWQ